MQNLHLEDVLFECVPFSFQSNIMKEHPSNGGVALTSFRVLRAFGPIMLF